MKIFNNLLADYETTKLYRYDNIGEEVAGLRCDFDDLEETENDGVLKVNALVDGKLKQVYTQNASHVAVIAATRQGKTTSYVIPSILSMSKGKRKKSMIVSDPKGEIYRLTAPSLAKEGYSVRLLNFRDAMHSEYWNPLLPIFRKYQHILSVSDEVKSSNNGKRNLYFFNGKTYTSEKKVNDAVESHKSMLLDEISNDIDTLCYTIADTKSLKDPYWEDAARDMLKAFIWAMLEDSSPTNPRVVNKEVELITENTFSFNTILSILTNFKDAGRDPVFNDFGYFADRDEDSLAYGYAKNSFLENAPTTRKCVVSCFTSKIAIFRESAVKQITTCNTLNFDELIEKPTVIFIDYKDESKNYYNIISLFVQEAYRHLIGRANSMPCGQLDVPFYFILDEFGNFPRLLDFETTISACGGRNIFFIIILQSYAQLKNVYGEAIADIIKDNLNMHVFFGSNNVNTLSEFSKECGEFTRLSPLSALNGNENSISNFTLETIPLVPKSRLAYLQPGECIITEVNCGYVLWSKLERYYLCNELNGLPQGDYRDYVCNVDPYEAKYKYRFKKKKINRGFPFL